MRNKRGDITNNLIKVKKIKGHAHKTSAKKLDNLSEMDMK